MEARLAQRDGKVIVDCGDFSLDVPEDKAEIYRPHVGKEIVLMREQETSVGSLATIQAGMGTGS